MRGSLVGITIAIALASTGARADCTDGGVSSTCQPAFSVTVGTLPSVTGAPLLEIDAVIQDNSGALIHSSGGAVFVTVRGDGADGGGVFPEPDGGFGTSPGPFIAPLTLRTFTTAGGGFTSTWDGGASLFLGSNTVVVSAVKPSGTRANSAPQIVFLTSNTGSGDGGTSSGDGGTAPDGGPTFAAALHVATSGESGGGCTTAGGPPSFLLMALAVMLAGLARGAMRG